MKRSYLLSLLCISIIFFSCNKTDSNELPMYGGIEKTEEQKQADDLFIAEVTKDMTKEEAAELFVNKGWEYFYSNDYLTAMERFNQAWLLDPDNYQIYNGFGAVLGVKKEYSQSIDFLKKALGMNDRDVEIYINLGFEYMLLASEEKNKEERQKALKKSIEYFSKGEQIDSGHPLLYNNWAITLMEMGNFDEAWEKLQKAKELGYEPDPGFENQLGKLKN